MSKKDVNQDLLDQWYSIIRTAKNVEPTKVLVDNLINALEEAIAEIDRIKKANKK